MNVFSLASLLGLHNWLGLKVVLDFFLVFFLLVSLKVITEVPCHATYTC